jgi:hypothetical protein
MTNRNNNNKKPVRWAPCRIFTEWTPENPERDAILSLTQTVPEHPEGLVHFSYAMGRVKTFNEPRFEGDDKAGFVVLPHMGIMMELKEGMLVPTAATMQRMEDFNEFFAKAVSFVIKCENEQLEERRLAKEAKMEAINNAKGIGAPQVRSTGKTKRERDKKLGVTMEQEDAD